MKRICNGLWIFLILTACFSCTDFMDFHKEYINKDGEIVYAPKIESLVFLSGRNRLKFQFWLNQSPNVRSVDLYWNDDKDSLIIPVTPTADRDSFAVIVPNLEEKIYSFKARTTDLYGHKSLFMTGLATVYGEDYESTLNPRNINALTFKEVAGEAQGLVSLFAALYEGQISTEIRYQQNNGSTAIISVKNNESEVFCPEAKAGSFVECRSLYVPEAGAIDTFATAWKTSATAFPSIYEYNCSTWTIVSVSSEEASVGIASNILKSSGNWCTR